MVATTSGALTSLYPALIIALSNIAPFLRNLSVVASNRLIQLFNSFSNPRFLLADESHPRLLFFMCVYDDRQPERWSDETCRLEVFNSVIFHRLTDNPNLLHGIITSHKVFQDLGTFTLARGLQEIRRVEMAKEEQARQSEHDRKAIAAADVDLEAGDTQAEKMRLLQNDSERGGEVELSDMSGHENVGVSPNRSEKARGKMRERQSSSLDSENSEDSHVGVSNVGRNNFVPTEEWVRGDSLYETWIETAV